MKKKILCDDKCIKCKLTLPKERFIYFPLSWNCIFVRKTIFTVGQSTYGTVHRNFSSPLPLKWTWQSTSCFHILQTHNNTKIPSLFFFKFMWLSLHNTNLKANNFVELPLKYNYFYIYRKPKYIDWLTSDDSAPRRILKDARNIN